MPDTDALQRLFALTSDFYWEQDDQFRFTSISGPVLQRCGIDPQSMLGRCRWDDAEPLDAHGGWDAHRALLAQRQPFVDLVYAKRNEQGELRHVSTSGVPVFDAEGVFQGYVGLSRDVTTSVRTAQALHESKLVLENTLEHMDQGISIVDADLRMIGMNRRFRELLGFPESLCSPGTPFADFVRYNAERGDYGAGDVDEQVRQRVALARRFEPHLFQRERPDGSVIEVRGSPLPAGGFVTIYTDVTQRARAERALRDSEERFRSLTALSSDWFWEQDAELRFTRLEGQHLSGDNRAFEQELGRTWWDLGFEPDGGWATHRELMRQRQPFRELVLTRQLDGGHTVHARVSGEPVLARNGELLGYRGVARDITAQRQAEERVQYLATHDGLTGLPNRVWFHELLSLELKAAKRYGRRLAVMFIDLDRFKVINDSLGHDAGDALLKEVASRLTACLRTSDVVARLGGDEFVVMLREVHTQDQAATVAGKVLASVLEPVTLLGQTCRISASIGVSLYPEDGQDVQALMKNADIAMYQAKEDGKNAFQFYSRDVEQQTLERLTLETQLRNALGLQELSLHYQPRVDLRSGSVTGVEALLRWNNAQMGSVSPARFIPVAEQTGLIVPIGRWVLHTACAQNVAWQRQGLPPLRVSVNLSARQFAEDDLVADITAALAASGMDPQWLELEITESMVMQDTERSSQVLARLRRLGVSVSIDDFGTGYSSLAQIKRFPISALKVDRSFIRDLAHDAADRAITEAIIALGKTLGLAVVAEGVETDEQLQFLRERGCDEMQGFHFCKPVPPAELQLLLERLRAEATPRP